MNPGSRKPTPRKTQRVATVFTGVTACAAAFAPAANAQAARPPAAVGTAHTGHKVREPRVCRRRELGSHLLVNRLRDPRELLRRRWYCAR
jgi:hypothetical protein